MTDWGFETAPEARMSPAGPAGLALPAVGVSVTFGHGNRVTFNVGDVDGSATHVRVFWGGSPIYDGTPDDAGQHGIAGSFFTGRPTELRVDLTYPEGTFSYARTIHAAPDTAGSYTLRRS